MSSLIGHTAAGITAYLWCLPAKAPPNYRAALPFVVLAVCPDLDYLAVWLLDYAATPRVTHSLLFALCTAVCMRALAPALTRTSVPLGGLLVAACSHPLLDLLVGAHPVPLAWPLPVEQRIAVGILPSAGALRLGNAYLWRNLLIELGVLLPLFAAPIALRRRAGILRHGRVVVCIAIGWLACLAWSISLPR